MNEPSLLLVNEPTSALESERGAAVVGLLRRLTTDRRLATGDWRLATGDWRLATLMVMVMVTHDRSHLAQADRVVEIVDGRLTPLARW